MSVKYVPVFTGNVRIRLLLAFIGISTAIVEPDTRKCFIIWHLAKKY